MVITMPRRAALDTARPRLEALLEQEYEGHTQALTSLMQRRRRRPGTDAATARVRAALAECAQALRRMAEGSYGTCECCAGDIELEYLEARPTARCCRTCTAAAQATPDVAAATA